MTHDDRMRSTHRFRSRLVRVGHAAAGLVLAASTASAQSPPAPASAPEPGPVTVRAAGAPQWKLEALVDRVWLVDAARLVPAGTRYLFLADNQLVVAVPGAAPTFGTWAESIDGLVTTTGKVSSDVEVLELTPERLRLRVTTPKTQGDISLVAAVRPPEPPAVETTTTQAPAPPPVPIGSPYRCGADAFRVSFEADKAYLTWPDGTSVVLSEVKVADAPASRRTYTDGQIRVVEDTSEAFTRVLFARAGFRPRPCSPAR